ncbi:hypothetical protein FXO38_05185 [Capsicum annuum]|nr:hypothetical protein FXO38_05185 [Capsicum annuum]
MNGVGRERGSTVVTTLGSIGRESGVAPSTIDDNGRVRGASTSTVIGVGRGKGRGAVTSTIIGVGRGKERGAGANKRRENNGVTGIKKGRGAPFKRPKMVGMKVLRTESGYKILNLGMPMNSSIATGHLGHHKPTSDVK